MYDLDGKRLLVISSDSNDIAFIKAAKEMGVYVVCCDRYADWTISPAKALADDAWDIDYTDTATVALKCTSENIDGVIAGYSEDRVLAACRISKAIGTPFYATEEQIEITRNKAAFKELCRQHGALTPCDYDISFPVLQKDKDSITYPVIVKPSDSGGRKGISVCDHEEQLEAAIALAVGESKNNLVVVEDYIVGTELSAVYTFVNGEISLSCLNDKYISEDQNGFSRLCDVAITPSKYHDLYMETVDSKIKDLLRSVEADNGVANLQFIARGDEIRAFEMGYRINGNDDFKVIRKYNGIDFMKMLISHSLTGAMGDDLKKDNPALDEYTCTLCMYLHGGTVGRVEYQNLIGKEGIDDVCVLRHPGAVIIEDGTNRQKALLIKLSAKTLPKVIELIRFIQANMIVENTDGNSMLLNPFDADRLLAN